MAINDRLLQLPENRALLGCACGSLSDKTSFVAALKEIKNWDSLLERLQNHRLTLLFFQHVTGHEAVLPPEVLASLQEASQNMLHQNLFLMTELQGVTAFLKAQNIRVLAFKGPSVAFNVYGSIALRGFSDLDLLISPRDREMVVAALNTRGFHERITELTPSLQSAKRRHGYEIMLLSNDGLTPLDVHWLIAPRYASFPLTFEAMWRRREEVRAMPGVSGLCREDLLLALSFHGLKHGWHDLEWIACVLALLLGARENPLDWTRIQAVAASGHCTRILHIALLLAVNLAQSSGQIAFVRDMLPGQVWQKLEKDKQSQKLSRQVWRFVLHSESHKASAQMFWKQELILGVKGREKFKSPGSSHWVWHDHSSSRLKGAKLYCSCCAA